MNEEVKLPKTDLTNTTIDSTENVAMDNKKIQEIAGKIGKTVEEVSKMSKEEIAELLETINEKGEATIGQDNKTIEDEQK